ncbi:MAG TPA: D-alanyl-D-alanine carboxypeptidase/D-alanyl-D-alanine-endopeptidase [Polyangia bacterium]|nr:D-alanyl-D-alanine carboxypeptidase/D-alanyl-D-alanine-endopeptidase [Polyangia bacterium]
MKRQAPALACLIGVLLTATPAPAAPPKSAPHARPKVKRAGAPVAKETRAKSPHGGALARGDSKAGDSKAGGSKAGGSKTDDAKPEGPTTFQDEVPRPADDDRDRDRIVRLQQTLNEILHNRTLGRLHVGLRVMSARTGRLFYGRHGDTLMDPASNQKVLATTAALLRLGADWRYRTEVTGPAPDDQGVIHGDLHLRGNGDPTLRSADLEALASRLRDRGVTRVEGAVVADARLLGVDVEGEGGEVKAALVVDHGMTVVRVRPGATAGAAPVVMTEQRRFSDESGVGLGFVVSNQAVTKPSGRTRIAVRLDVAGGRLRVSVSGRIATGAAGVAFRRRVPRPALHAAVLLRSALAQAGIAVRDAASTGPTTASDGLLEVHESPPLSVVLRRINKDSDNDQAERVLQTVGVEALGGPPTTEKGLTVLRSAIGSLGLYPGSYVARNGSGLGHINRITPRAMAELLRALYLDPRVGPEMLQSLSVGGVDGTTRNRFRGALASRRVRAKTGTLDGKSCLSGLVGDGDDVVVFSILVQGFRGRTLAAVRASQVGAVNAIMRYVREGTGERIELPPGFDEQIAAVDVETSGEIEESDAEGEVDTAEEPKTAPGEDAVDAYLRQARGPASPASPVFTGVGGANGARPTNTSLGRGGAPMPPATGERGGSALPPSVGPGNGAPPKPPGAR